VVLKALDFGYAAPDAKARSSVARLRDPVLLVFSRR